MKKILIVDDEPNVHYSFKKVFSKSYVVLSASSGEEAVDIISRDTPDLVIMDIRMPGIDGITTLRKIKNIDPKLHIIIMTAYGTMETAVEAMRLGAYDYTLKPFDIDWMKATISSALSVTEMMKRKVALSPSQEGELNGDIMVGNSPEMQKVYKYIGQVAGKDITVLLTGESGTGKELVARAIYKHSTRRDKPFMAINCAAIPDNLLESELFGYEKGAFTDARLRKIGKLEQLSGGTILLDEIGDMSLLLQAKMLRVLQEMEFERLGGNETIKVDIRVIAATNKDLRKEVAEGRFREDLYYRLNVVSIYLPPLRERKGDIPDLVRYFIKKSSPELNKEIKDIAPSAIKVLMGYHWPGNVRELENVVKKAIIRCKSEVIVQEDLSFEEETNRAHTLEKEGGLVSGLNGILDRLLEEIPLSLTGDKDVFSFLEKMLVIKALMRTKGNQVKAAKLLGINRNSLRRRMEKYGVQKEISILGAFTKF
ncbi:MAG: sigma-54-dependent Fis family transcriptional regulator [Desulfobacterales bacterium]|nr:sigma-54-dependent Fis family transcriptional regulator [Desulfobacterales bacterium]